MGNISKLLKKMKKTKKEFDEQMNKHIQELDKIRQVVKYNYVPRDYPYGNKTPNFCKNCGGKL